MLSIKLTDKKFWDNNVEAYVFLMKENLDSASDLDSISKIETDFYPHLKQILKRHKFNGQKGQSYVLTAEKNGKLLQFFFVGLGKLDQAWDRNLEILRRAWASAVQRMKHLSIESAIVALPETEPFKVSSVELLKQLVINSYMADYEFIQFKSNKKDDWNCQLFFDVIDEDFTGFTQALEYGKSLGSAINTARHWIDLPGNIIHPGTLSEEAQKIANEHKNLSCTIFGHERAQELGMGSFLSVARGSEHEGKFVILEYKAADNNAPTIALCGKGVTFDTGGISLKPSASMDGMKYDMAGAASVIVLMNFFAQLKPNVNIIGITPLVENMPSGRASRQDDIVVAMNGKSIEIKSTDAEGRLILADAICYAEKFHTPDIIIDIATLTGACAYAVGHLHMALISRDEDLKNALLASGKLTGDKMWPLPIDDDFVLANNSDVADLSNTGARSYGAGTITAACFLEAFVSKARWAHLDIASTASDAPGINYLGKGATGASIRALADFVISHGKQDSLIKNLVNNG